VRCCRISQLPDASVVGGIVHELRADAEVVGVSCRPEALGQDKEFVVLHATKDDGATNAWSSMAGH